MPCSIVFKSKKLEPVCTTALIKTVPHTQKYFAHNTNYVEEYLMTCEVIYINLVKKDALKQYVHDESIIIKTKLCMYLRL